MLVERSQHVGVAPYQRNSLRNGHSSGFKNRCIEIRLGAIDLKVPQVRNSDIPFYPKVKQHFFCKIEKRGMKKFEVIV